MLHLLLPLGVQKLTRMRRWRIWQSQWQQHCTTKVSVFLILEFQRNQPEPTGN